MSQEDNASASAGGAVAEPPRVRVPHLAPAADTADAAATRVPDVLMRDYFHDTGAVPTNGWVSESPDIIPYGGDLLSFGEAVRTYNGPDDLGKPVVQDGTNNIYVRAKSLYRGTESGTVSLYYCPSSLFLDPSQWRKNQLKTADGDTSVKLVNRDGNTRFSHGDILLGQEAFYLTGLQPGHHYCLIAVVNTDHTKVNIPPSFANIGQFISWVAGTPGVAWRNINLVPNTVKQILQKLVFGNTGSAGSLFAFNVYGRNLPVGTTVTVQCTDQACPINANLTMPAPVGGVQYASVPATVVPGGVRSAITLTATPPAGQSFSPKSSLTVAYYEFPPPPEQMTELHHRLGRFIPMAMTAPDGTSTLTSQFALPVGQVTTDII